MKRSVVDVALEWCSIVGAGSRQQFETAVGNLVTVRPSSVLSGLELAGHLEVDWERTGRWSVNPPVLALPEGSGGNAYLTGARNEAMLKTIEGVRISGQVESLTVIPGGTSHASTWFLGVRSLNQLEAVAATIGCTVAVNPASLLVERFKTLDQILSGCQTEYVPSGFRARQLNIQTMRYESVDVKYANWPPGCFEQLSGGRRKYIFVDNEDRRHVCDRWVATHAELRRQRQAGVPVPEVLQWDLATGRMAVFASAQLPAYWARAAIFCSGLPPHRVETATWTDVYEGVPPLLYSKFCGALDMQPSRTDLSKFDRERP